MASKKSLSARRRRQNERDLEQDWEEFVTELLEEIGPSTRAWAHAHTVVSRYVTTSGMSPVKPSWNKRLPYVKPARSGVRT